MAKAVRTKNEHQQNIVKMLNGLAGRYARWTVWQDFITMAAICIANTVNSKWREEREARYRSVAEKYHSMELDIFAKMITEVTLGLNENPEQDFLGELFMALDMGNEWRGQFFTPYDVCRAAAEISARNVEAESKVQSWVSVNDPACGAGAMLIAFGNVCKSKGVNYQNDVLFVAQDIDELAGMMCYIQLSLLGCAGYVVIDNTLSKPAQSIDDRGLIPVDCGNVWATPMYTINDLWWVRRKLAQRHLVLPRKECFYERD